MLAGDTLFALMLLNATSLTPSFYFSSVLFPELKIWVYSCLLGSSTGMSNRITTELTIPLKPTALANSFSNNGSPIFSKSFLTCQFLSHPTNKVSVNLAGMHVISCHLIKSNLFSSPHCWSSEPLSHSVMPRLLGWPPDFLLSFIYL